MRYDHGFVINGEFHEEKDLPIGEYSASYGIFDFYTNKIIHCSGVMVYVFKVNDTDRLNVLINDVVDFNDEVSFIKLRTKVLNKENREYEKTIDIFIEPILPVLKLSDFKYSKEIALESDYVISVYRPKARD